MEPRTRVNFAMQILLGLLFLVSAILKFSDIRLFTSDLVSFSIIPLGLTEKFAIALIIIELLIGFNIIAGIWTRFMIIVAILLLLLFELLAVYSVVAEKNWVCNCFGPVFRSKFSYSTIIRDGLFLALAVYTYFFRPINYKFENLSTSMRNGLTGSFIGLCLLILIYNNQMVATQKTIKVGFEMPDQKLTLISGQVLETKNITSDYILFILFDVEKDCASCLAEFIMWNKLQQEFHNRIQLIGIMHAPNQSYVKQWVNARRIKFPFVYDQNKQIINLFGVKTPAKILVDKTRQVAAISDITGDEKLQSTFISMLKKQF